MRTFRYFLPLIFFIFVTGCIGPLRVEYKPGQIPDTSKAAKPTVVLLKSYTDSRAGVDSKYVGKINATVTDMHDDKIVMDRDVASFVTEAVKTHLTSAGFTVTTPSSPPYKGGDRGGDADIIISGEIKKFRLDIGGRDEIEIELATRAVKGKTEKVIWEGVITEKEDRYAGVFGNSRKSIGAYISKTLSKAINKTFAEINISFTKRDSSASPQNDLKLPQNDLRSAGESPILEGSGRLFITTEPDRAKVYIGDVYYGLSPLSIDIEPAVYDMAVRLEGFKERKEKVSVRKGQRTELEIKMEKERD